MKTTLVLIGALIAARHGHEGAGVGQSPSAGWVEVSPPSSERVACALMASRDWQVSLQGDRLVIRELNAQAAPPRPNALRAASLPNGPLAFTQVTGGYLVALDLGEFGGWLRWYSSDGMRWRGLSDAPTVAVIGLGRHAAIAVRRIGRGVALDRISRRAGTWQVDRTIDLPSGSAAITRDGEQALVAHSGGLSRFDPVRGLQLVTAIELAGSLPNSVVVDGDRRVWVGLRDFVLLLQPVGGNTWASPTWWAPKSCAKARYVGKECICEPGPTLP